MSNSAQISKNIALTTTEREALDGLAEILARHLLAQHKEELQTERETVAHATPGKDHAPSRHLHPV